MTISSGTVTSSETGAKSSGVRNGIFGNSAGFTAWAKAPISKRMAVGRRLGHDLVADHAAGAGLVLDDDRLAQHLLQPGRDQPGRRVGAAASRIGHDQPHRLGGIGLRTGKARRQRQGCRRAEGATP